MASLYFTANSIGDVSNGDTAAITGKNGFIGIAGTIPILVTEISSIDMDSNVLLNVEGLNLLEDKNFSNHLLEVNDGFFNGLKGLDYISVPVNEKSNTGAALDFVGYNPSVTQYSSNILSYNISANTITFENEQSQGVGLFDVLPTPPFYAKLAQIIDTRFFTSKKFYITGSNKYRQVVNNVENLTGSNTFDLKIKPRTSNEITVWVDGNIEPKGAWVWDNLSNITLDISSGTRLLKTRVDYYTAPAVEIGDNISFYSENVYAVANVSYDISSPTYNVDLTTANFYEIELRDNIKANVSGLTFVNISNDIVGLIGNVDVVANSFSLDYNENVYTGNFNLANNQLYNIQVPLDFKPVTLSSDRVLKDVNPGISIVRARNMNSSGRRSPFVRKEVQINEIPIKKVDNLTISEQLYKDTSQGIIVRAVISFDAILDQEVSDYEVSFKLNSSSADLSTFNTVKLPASGIDSDGKIRYVINNLDRGRISAINSITVRVVPLNKGIRGITAEASQSIIGKSAPPLNIQGVAGGQEGQTLKFIWKVPTNSDGTVVDLDLNEIIIKRLGGIVDPADAASKWPIADPVAKVATPANSVTLSIGNYGVYTYFFKTKDTSSNESEEIRTLTISTQRPARIDAYKAWSEDEPSSNIITGQPNEAPFENNYPSFADSLGGLSSASSGLVDNANGSSSGWTVISGSPTDLLADDNATYTTQIRDVGSVITGSIIVTANGSQGITSTFNDLKEIILTGATETSPGDNVLVDVDFGGIGHILGFDNATAAVVSYNSYFRTLTSGGDAGNVYAIWNAGQYVGDDANANSWALIAGVINANAIALGDSYWANGMPTGTNLLSNINSSTSYELVNLEQFIDDTGQLTFQGQNGIIDTNLEYRYTTANPYYANGNVNALVFSDGVTNDGWKPYGGSTINFRWFQVRFNVQNSQPNQADYLLDKLNYSIDIENKIYTETITVTTSPQSIDFSNRQFIEPPNITLTLGSDNNYLPVLIPGWSKDGANINVYSNTGSAVTGVEVTVTAIGV